MKLKCPFCGSSNVIEWQDKYENGILEPIATLYKCNSCGKFSEKRHFPNYGKESLELNGDNHPALPMHKNWAKEREELINFKDIGIVPKTNRDNLTDLWIDMFYFLKEKGVKK